MLRSTVLLVLAAALAASSLWLAWGEKTVVYEECRLDVERGRVCVVHEVHAFYDPTFLRGETLSYEVVERDGGRVESARFWRSYDDPAQGEADWWRSPLLPWARPLLVSAAVAAPVAAAVGWLSRRRWTALAAWVPLGSACVSGAASVASLGGVALHASSWAATYVEPLRPAAGTWVLAAAGVAGVAGGLRMHAVLRDAAAGRTGASPLVPATTLYGFDPDEPDAAREPARRLPLRWPEGGAFVVAAVLLLLLPLGLPLATKDITPARCEEDPTWGSICRRGVPVSVTYHAAHATVVGPGATPWASELLPNVHGNGAASGLHYFGAFQDAYGGPAWMGAGAVAMVLGGIGLVAWLAASAVGRRTGRLCDGASLLLAGGFLLALLGVAVQAGTWVGVPAHASEPANGFWVGVVGLAVLGTWRVRLRRAGRAVSGTATTTSRAE